jgi:hypothetical protein
MKVMHKRGWLFVSLIILLGHLICIEGCAEAYPVSLGSLLLDTNATFVPKDYLHYTFAEYGFSVDSPIKLSSASPYKSASLLIYEYNGEIPGKANIGVYFYHLPRAPHDEREIKRALDDLQESFIGDDFKVLTTKSLHLEGAYAREVFYSIPETDEPIGRGHTRLILFKNTVCVLSVVTPDSQYSSTAFASFFDSFKILKTTR